MSARAVNCVSKLLHNKTVCRGIAIKTIGELLGFFEEFSIFGFENHYSTAKQKATGLEVERLLKTIAFNRKDIIFI